jgi:hypothetical protein
VPFRAVYVTAYDVLLRPGVKLRLAEVPVMLFSTTFVTPSQLGGRVVKVAEVGAAVPPAAQVGVITTVYVIAACSPVRLTDEMFVLMLIDWPVEDVYVIVKDVLFVPGLKVMSAEFWVMLPTTMFDTTLQIGGAGVVKVTEVAEAVPPFEQVGVIVTV